jgi:hypothetical protein
LENDAFMKKLLSLALILGALPLSTPVMAQERVLTIFGNDPCPAGTTCVRASEKERYRIPKGLRQVTPSPDSQSWAVRSQATLAEGYSGPGCSAAGGIIDTCFAKQLRAAREEAKLVREAKKAERDGEE